jgi:hypothetical protein
MAESREVLMLLMRPVGTGPLSDAQCDTIFALSIILWRPVTLVSVEEMIGKGVLSGLDDAELRRLLFELPAESRACSVFMAYVGDRQNMLMDDYPTLTPRRMTPGRRLLSSVTPTACRAIRHSSIAWPAIGVAMVVYPGGGTASLVC